MIVGGIVFNLTNARDIDIQEFEDAYDFALRILEPIWFFKDESLETTLLIVESYHVNGVTEQWFVITLLYYELFALQIKRNNILVAT